MIVIHIKAQTWRQAAANIEANDGDTIYISSIMVLDDAPSTLFIDNIEVRTKKKEKRKKLYN